MTILFVHVKVGIFIGELQNSPEVEKLSFLGNLLQNCCEKDTV